MTAPGQVRVMRAMPESELQGNVIEMCRLLGYPVFQVLNSRGMSPGWPDLVILGRTRILYREIKSETGSLTPEQRRIGQAIQSAGGDWAVWRPRDLVTRAIQDQLRLIGGSPVLPFEVMR
jgi:hypothetical protein